MGTVQICRFVQTNIRGIVRVEGSQDVSQLHCRAGEIVSEDLRRLHPFRPVRTPFPCPRSVRRIILQIKYRGLRKVERSASCTGRVVNELRVDDGIERDLHLEPVSHRIDEPDKATFRLAEICDQIVLAYRRSYAAPSAYSEVGARNDGDRYDSRVSGSRWRGVQIMDMRRTHGCLRGLARGVPSRNLDVNPEDSREVRGYLTETCSSRREALPLLAW